MRGWAFLPLLAFAVACSHDSPFESADQGGDMPFSNAAPIRLTYNDGDDRTVSWMPDGAAIIYSSEQVSDADADRCLHLLPAGGGQVDRQICARYPAEADTTDRFESPAVNASGRLAYLRAVGWIGQQKNPRLHLMLGQLDDPLAAVEVTGIPYLAPSGITHNFVSHIQWLGPDRLVYLAQDLFYQGSTFFPDTFTTGLEIMRGDVSGSTLELSVVPGTTNASSVAAGGDDDTIILTLAGDSRVYRQSLSTGERTVLHDFGDAGIARDAQLHGNTLVAIVGRSVLFQFEDAHGWVQRDEGGDLHIVNLDTGTSVVHSLEETLFRRPAISPDGTRIVVEASPFAPVHVGPLSDYNATNHRPDLWLFDLQ